MLLSISLDSFKNHTGRSFLCGDKNILTGPNGSGKTNVLEAIYLFVNAFPPHERLFTQLIPTVSKTLSLEGTFERNNLPYKGRIGYSIGDSKVHFLSQDSLVTRARYKEIMPIRAVLFTPMEMNILYLGPSLRRDFLDEAVLLSFPEFGKVKREYTLALKNRNTLLKQIREGVSTRETLGLWDSLFVAQAKEYYIYRLKLIYFIRENIPSIESFLDDKYTLSFEYNSKVNFENLEQSILQYLQDNKERDIITGHTYIGPHLDDFHFNINSDIHSNSYLSRGENKTILIGLKYIIIDFIEKSSKKDTILLIDDLFSELDTEHITTLLQNTGNRQLFISSQNIPSFLINSEDFRFHNI